MLIIQMTIYFIIIRNIYKTIYDYTSPKFDETYLNFVVCYKIKYNKSPDECLHLFFSSFSLKKNPNLYHIFLLDRY